jgi:hypothetical protein
MPAQGRGFGGSPYAMTNPMLPNGRAFPGQGQGIGDPSAGSPVAPGSGGSPWGGGSPFNATNPMLPNGNPFPGRGGGMGGGQAGGDLPNGNPFPVANFGMGGVGKR